MNGRRNIFTTPLDMTLPVHSVNVSLCVCACVEVFAKTSKGRVRKSIFATPDSTSGRVGIGTCGVSGRPMTKFTYMEKWKK